jgi:serine/threonine protein kinase
MVLRDEAYGTAIDVWAVGCVAFEALAGRQLFNARDEPDMLLKFCAVRTRASEQKAPATHARTISSWARRRARRRAGAGRRLRTL